MSIINDLQDISNVTIGSENIENIYLGEDLLWTAESDPLYKCFSGVFTNFSSTIICCFYVNSTTLEVKYVYKYYSLPTVVATNSSELDRTLAGTETFFNGSAISGIKMNGIVTNDGNSLVLSYYTMRWGEIQNGPYDVMFTRDTSHDLYE